MGNKITHTYEKKYNFDTGTSIQSLYNQILTNILEDHKISIIDDPDNIKDMFIREPIDKEIIKKSKRILYATWTSSCWHFIDDIIILIGEENDKNYVYTKSVSRKGEFDFGQNKKHIKKIMKGFKYIKT